MTKKTGRRANGEGSLYFDERRRLWRGAVQYRDASTGKSVRKYVSHRTQAGARERLTEMRRQLETELTGFVIDSGFAKPVKTSPESTSIMDFKTQSDHGSDIKTAPVSILIPTYNREQFIALAVQSALMQSLPVAEIIVVDDGSTDRSADVMGRFNNPRVRYVRKEHSEAPATRNRAVREASQPWLLWLDSDDMLLPDAVRHHMQALEKTPDADVIYGDLMTVFEDLSPRKPLRYPDWYGRNRRLLARLLQSNAIPNPGTMVRAELYRHHGMYDESFRRAHDYEWWVRIAPTARCKHSGETVVLWRWHDTNMSSGSVNIDYSYDARIVRSMLKRYSLQELYPLLEWGAKPEEQVEGIACLHTAIRLINLGDFENGLQWLLRSWKLNPSNQVREIMQKLGIVPSLKMELVSERSAT